MKRILTSFALVAASLAFSQVSISGETNDTPKATLDVKAIDNGKANGILIPRVTKAVADAMPNPENASAIEESTLIYITGDVSGNATNYATNVDANGFYYFKDGKWVKLGGGATAATSTFLGPVKGNIRSKSLPLLSSDWTAEDFTIVVTGDGSISLPDPGGANTGRIISVKNGNGSQRAYTDNSPLNNSVINPQFGHIIQSDGNDWYVIGGL